MIKVYAVKCLGLNDWCNTEITHPSHSRDMLAGVRFCILFWLPPYSAKHCRIWPLKSFVLYFFTNKYFVRLYWVLQYFSLISIKHVFIGISVIIIGNTNFVLESEVNIRLLFFSFFFLDMLNIKINPHQFPGKVLFFKYLLEFVK